MTEESKKDPLAQELEDRLNANPKAAADTLKNQAQTDPSQTGRWSANPKDVQDGGDLPEAEPDNMPGDTEVQSKTIWHRY